MTLPASGIIKLSDIQTEFGGANPIGLSEYYRGGAYVTSNNTGVPTSGAISISNFYGAVSQFAFIISANTQEANLNTLATAAGWDGSAPVVATISSGVYLWSDDTANPGLLINIANCTISNNGNIIGKGGGAGVAGGPAISVTEAGVVITNNSGAYIAGGGGGGGQGYGQVTDGTITWTCGGGGGAGGGNGGSGFWYNSRNSTSASTQGDTSGGTIGLAGSTPAALNSFTGSGTTYASLATGQGGGSGGGGGLQANQTMSSGGGGGRILPGVGGSVNASGGSAGAVGSASGSHGGGGGGWGAAGGSGSGGAGGAGGAAISGTSPTLTNSGTIYGSTV